MKTLFICINAGYLPVQAKVISGKSCTGTGNAQWYIEADIKPVYDNDNIQPIEPKLGMPDDFMYHMAISG
ncbi:hypothetical protein KHS38_02770 [Mucilaginibacter sp. Bleaf8]|uniref:hypothetical protein n=1 Tax=Mucilaginibacter sp. Bleaf8 TaxID=2834430 RepID=UPI001BCDC31A|nr:hypothetical protein [Mucilaginibacter sp. Bleaf8]MBS7563315.1 hypothetical protein [Mucilaginibacter sp. Bleaf8]